MMKTIKWLAGAALAAALAACGGGGGSAGSVTGGGVSGGGGSGGAGSPSLTLNIVDGTGAQVTAVGATGTYKARATVKDAAGVAVTGLIVNFSVGDTSLAKVTPSTGLTDSTGTAEVIVSPASGSSVGATTVTADAVVGTTSVTGTRSISVNGGGVSTQGPSIAMKIVDGSSNVVTSLTFGGTYKLQAKVTDGTGSPIAAKLVTFGVNNGQIATLTPNSALTDSSGLAQVTISPASLSAAGATTASAAALVGTASVTGNTDFAVAAASNAGAPTIALTIVNGSNAATTSLAIGGSYRAQARVLDASGAAVTSKLVTFSVSNPNIANVTPTTALTDNTGLAQVNIAPTSVTSLGAATLSASTTVGTTPVLSTKDFSVSASNLSLSALNLGSNNLASGANTPVSVTALIGGSPANSTPVNVLFSASCGRINNQTNFSTTTDGSGVASVTYSAVALDGSLCSGVVTISATAAGASAQSATINVSAPVANAITFVNANPPQIFVKGSGAAEQSVVSFKVLAGNTPMANVPVQFSIVTNPGGVGLGSTGSTAPVTVTTDSAGIAAVSVFSGTIPGPVKVRAELVANAAVFAETQNLNVSSGPPSQRFMSVSVETFNIEGWTEDGTNTKITARVADRQGNPVEDGTVINFTTEGGQVASSCATSRVNGISLCSVNFETQNPRLDPDGRFSVLAFTAGTKDYDDVNGNNIYDAGVDTLKTIGDAYRDDNEDGVFQAGEFVIPRGGATACAGTGEPFPSKANTCDSNLATTVRQQVVIMFSSSTPVLANVVKTTDAISFTMGSIHHPKLPMPAGTLVTAEASGGTCAVDKVFGGAVPNVDPGTDKTANLQTSHVVTLKNCAAGNIVDVKVTSPGGLITDFVFTL